MIWWSRTHQIGLSKAFKQRECIHGLALLGRRLNKCKSGQTYRECHDKVDTIVVEQVHPSLDPTAANFDLHPSPVSAFNDTARCLVLDCGLTDGTKDGVKHASGQTEQGDNGSKSNLGVVLLKVRSQGNDRGSKETSQKTCDSDASVGTFGHTLPGTSDEEWRGRRQDAKLG